MKKVILAIALTGAAFAQQIYAPLVAADNVATTLSSPMLISDSVAVVVSGAGWLPNMVAYICDSTSTGTAGKCAGTFEVMLVTNVAGNVLTLTRGYSGTTAIAHAKGRAIANAVTAAYNNSLVNLVTSISTNVRSYGAKCDGSADDSAAINSTVAAVPSGGTVLFPPNATCLIGSGVTVAHPNIFLVGSGGSVLKAKNSAGILGGLVVATNAATGLVIRNLTIDGNRANGGMNAVTGVVGQWAVNISGSDALIDNVEVKNSSAIGVFVGDTSISPAHVTIQNSNIHDNGGVTVAGSGFGVPGGFGVGVMSGGAASPVGLTIANNHIENNHNTVTSPGDSTALNLLSNKNIVTGNYVKNNYNVNGGQIVIGIAASSATASDSIVSNNTVIHSGSFGGDVTDGIEIDSSYVTVTGNLIVGGSEGIIITTDSNHIVVTGNTAHGCTGSGIVAINAAGGLTGPTDLAITGNNFSANAFGVAIQSKVMNTSVVGNNVFGNSTQPVAGQTALPAANNVEIRENPGYNGSFTSSMVAAITVGASPFVYAAGVSPEMVYIRGGTVSAVTKYYGGSSTGVNLCTATECYVLVPPNQSISISYSVLPTMIKDVL